MQKLFREWHALEQRPDANPGRGAALGRRVDSSTVRVRPSSGCGGARRRRVGSEAWAVGLFDQAAAARWDSVPIPNAASTPAAVGLRPERWEQDGLYDEPG